MRHFLPTTITALLLAACGGAPPAQAPTDSSESPTATEPAASPNAPAATEAPPTDSVAPADKKDGVQLSDSAKPNTAKNAHGVSASKIKATKTEAAMKFVVVDKEKGPIPGIVVVLTAPNGTKYHTTETDATGYAEVLVPNGNKYDVLFMSLGRQKITTSMTVTNEPRQSIRLTLRYKRFDADGEAAPRFVLKGVTFDTGKAKLRAESLPRLAGVLEYMTHKQSSRIEISGHTDNVGKPKSNKALSEKRAQACRDYLISKGIDGSRIEAIGYGDERPIESNTTKEGRQENRRIEATEL